MSNSNVSQTKQLAAHKKARWIIYPGLAIITVLLFGVCGLFFLGSFAHLRNPTPPAIMRLMQARSHAINASASSKVSIGIYSTPQAYTAYWQAMRSGNQQQRLQLEQTGRVLALPAGTLIWYQPLTESGTLTPVHLIGSKYIGRTYWVTHGELGA
jgi:hypothetical protein